MSLPSKVVDRLFDRLIGTYGREFMGRWDGINEMAVKTLFAHELSGFADRLDCIAWALENLPERAPNVIQFRNLCRQAPAPEVPRLEVVAAGRERVQAELARLTPVLAQPIKSNGRQWAHDILARHEAGARIFPATLKIARAAAGRLDAA